MPSLSSHSSLSHPNFILAALSGAELETLTPHLTPCLLHLGQTLYERGDEIKQVYFPKSGVVSLVSTSQSGVDVEVGLVGREGVTGALEVINRSPATTRAIVQMAGSGWRMPSVVLCDEFTRGGSL